MPNKSNLQVYEFISLRLSYTYEKATQQSMSEEQLKAFLAKVQGDSSLQE